MRKDIRHDEGRGRFWLPMDGGEAYLVYAPADAETLDFLTTFVPPSARGREVGATLVKRGLDHAREKGMKVIPTCGFVRTVVRRYPEYRDLLVGPE